TKEAEPPTADVPPSKFPGTLEIALDSPENVNTKKWIMFGRGQPVISMASDSIASSEPRACPVSSIRALGEYFMDVIKSKYHPRTVLPLTAENICVLTRRLYGQRPDISTSLST
ncbi:hypothetical protein, partial [Erythrobacter sp. YJ-T3-07]|uniref:hypothetical protein n=1 Tax=Erythrobacter sp. YJ-T3-07 TaxID=2793063 RepID=UPI001F41FDF1